MKKELWYLGSPYSHPNEKVRQKRYDDMCLITSSIIKYHPRVIPFSPIVNSHVLETEYNATPEIGWVEFDLELLILFDKLAVVMLDGWNESEGVAREIKFALENDMTIVYVDPANYITLDRRYRMLNTPELLKRPISATIKGS